ncbi:MAG: hypothetical protein JWM11_6440 [Planctomycetaceae bacterium]|nr:hypothetical protein [Planctomycetaceae bacterium]
MNRSLSHHHRKCLAALSLCGVFCIWTPVAHSAEPAVRVVSDAQGRPMAFEAFGISQAQLATLAATDLNEGTGLRLLTIHVAEPGKPTSQPPMLGAYQWQGSALRFTPRYALRAGLNYRAEFRPDAELVISDSVAQANNYRDNTYRGKPVRLDLPIPKAANEKPTEVTQIYPSANVLPENQLKFYLHFSAPMSQREAYQHLELLKADGTPVDLPFLELGEELWDGTGTRLTLLIDPGRIKQGVKPREDLGPALESGHDYTLVVHSDWNDAAGNPLSKAARKVFRAGPAERTALDTATWKITPPRSGTKDPLTVRFPRSLDRALLERTFTVKDFRKIRIPGQIAISDAERQWAFRPDAPWVTGTSELVIDTVLEDLAGNRIGRAFEVDQDGTVDKTVQAETLIIPIKILAPM